MGPVVRRRVLAAAAQRLPERPWSAGHADIERRVGTPSPRSVPLVVPGVPSDVGGSTWQSLTRGTGNVETDYLNGEIALIAHRTGQSAPVNARLAVLARQAAATGLKPGGMTADELAERLGLA